MVFNSFRSYSRIGILLLLFVFVGQALQAQVYREKFGKSRIQYKEFNWRFYYSDNFEVYFYRDGEGIAKDAIEYLEEEFSRITETIGYPPYSKTRVFLYNSLADKQQSNVGLRGQDFSVGGQTNFIKSQIELAYTGNLETFKKELIYRVTNMLIEEMLFGGNIAEMFQSSFATPIPSWFTAGAAAFIAKGWNKESDDLTREYVTHNLTNKFNKLDPQKGVLIGQSIWNYITQVYGQRSVSNILNLARIIRNEESSIARTLGLTYSKFISDWRTYYSAMNVKLMDSYIEADRDNNISGRIGRSSIVTDVRISPEGKYVAYATMSLGQFQIIVVDLETGKEDKLFKGGTKRIDQEVDFRYPLLSWSDANTLGVVHNEFGKNILTIKRIGVKGRQRIEIPRFSQVNSFDFNSNGRLAVVSGTVKAASDIFLYNINRNSVRRLTNDTFDDMDARFIPDANQIVFSSNRTTDSVHVSGPSSLEEVNTERYNLFIYDLDNTDSVLTKLTNNLANESYPVASGADQVFYLSDQQGINNLYRHNIVDTISNQLSNYIYGIKDYDLNFETGKIAFISTELSRDAIYVEDFNEERSTFTPVTPRRALETTKILAERRRKAILASDTVRRQSTTEQLQDLAIPKRDSIPEGAINTENYRFDSKTKVDTKDYQFERPTTTSSDPGRSFLSIYQNSSTENKINGPINYETRFLTDNLVTTIVIDELRSVAQLMEIQMNDFQENHRFYGGLLMPYNFNSGYDVFGEYQFLKYQVDLRAKYYRKSLQRDDNTSFRQRYNLNRFELGLAYPLTPNLRVELSPFFAQTRYDDLDWTLLIRNPPPPEPSTVSASYVGLGFNLVYDQSLVTGTNLHDGTRAKIRFENYSKLNEDARSFGQLEIDVRHYERITRGVTLGFRGFFGKFFGTAPKKYLLGGVDNWVFNKTESCTSEDCPLFLETLFDNTDILFHRFINLRGYDYNTFNGRNVLTLSAELRLPVFELLDNRETRSNFLRNLQLLAFYDIGSAWDDLSPFREKNNLNTEIIDPGGQFDAVINNFNNPWLQSMGAGIRTMLLGFFSKIDVAWPIRNFKVESPRLQLSIGYDF